MNSENTTQAVLEIGKLIGIGAYGAVFKGRYNMRKAAIKRFQLHQHTTDQVETIQHEIDLLKHLQYRHIIQFYGVHRQGNEISLAMDFAEGGSLRQAIEDSRVAGWHIKSRIAQEMAYGLAYIHHEGILHRDLKSDNVLLTRHMEVKLCDFGLAVVKTSSGGHSTEVMRGTFRWMAPELVVSERPRYTTKSDMYAFGMVMWEMAAMCTVPFKAIANNLVMAQAVHGGQREQLPEKTPTIYQHWVDLCWKQDPSDRPDAHEVIIVDDASSVLDGTNTAGTLWCTLTDSTHEQSMVPGVSPMVTSAFAEARATQPLTELVSLSRKAVLNDADAQMSLAEMYEIDGSGVPKDNEKAFVWYLRAAQLGHLDAMDRVSGMYAEGRGTEQSEVEAVRWQNQALDQRLSNLLGSADIASHDASVSVEENSRDNSWFRTTSRKQLVGKKSSLGSIINVLDTNQDRVMAQDERGDARAQFIVGSMYEQGRGVEQSDVEAVKWYTKAVSQGNPNAQFNLGSMYEHGRGVEQSVVEAVKWFTKAASQGNSNAQCNLGLMYEQGRGVEQSDVEAVKWYTKAASLGNPSGQRNLGLMYLDGRGVEQSDVDAVKWYTKAASQGNPQAQKNLGLMYLYGRGVEQSDVEAVKCSAQGNAHGHGNLASMYELGFGVEPSDHHALDLFTRAHDKGYPSAHFHVKWLTSPDRRTPCSDSDAVEVNRVGRFGTEKGYATAQHNLGRLYERGRGVRVDKIHALAWYRQAAAQGHLGSQQRMELFQRQ
ncbi:hypothetical protein DFQ27_009262 [Actinomortierella ambigua]|uniref:Protein kinase domain-containing protein n=1 Tax=Actinomortierella ambigua TaxID=1343610 RepID=A0A9P6PRN6_9FUNG|nr:hypothetical protein DFQ27_009262 [Actinomortierella ambigua]